MLRLKILVIECNDLAALTVNSIKQNMPDWSYEVVAFDRGYIRTALQNADDICLCVRSGVMLNVQDKDLPPRSILREYDIALARDGVFSDNRNTKHIYGLIGNQTNKKVLDLSVFIINPQRWIVVPESDAGVLPKVKRLRMPRHMNHKCDPLIKKAVASKVAMDYGMLGRRASVHNYVPVYESGKANANEMFAYWLELALPLLDGLPESVRKKVEAVASKTDKRVAKLRNGLAQNLPLGAET